MNRCRSFVTPHFCKKALSPGPFYLTSYMFRSIIAIKEQKPSKQKLNKSKEGIKMPKKNMSPEEKKAWGEKMKAARAVKKNVVGEESSPVEPSISNEDYKALLDRVKELEAKQSFTQPQQTSQVGPRGNLVGTFEKYRLDPLWYPDPRTRLAQEQKLQRFAFNHNYELGWEIGSSFYQTIDGVNTREPKFTLELHRIVMDEDTGEPTNGRHVVCRMIFHEDPQAAIQVARENGLSVDDSNEKEFLDEMRYLRMRDWLVEAFYPPRPTQAKKNKKEVVVGNKLVEFFEVNSEQSENIPFSQLNNKL